MKTLQPALTLFYKAFGGPAKGKFQRNKIRFCVDRLSLNRRKRYNAVFVKFTEHNSVQGCKKIFYFDYVGDYVELNPCPTI